MARYYGKVGYGISVETAPDVWKPSIVERYYYGDVMQDSRRWDSGENLNANLNINNKISIVADPYAYSNFRFIRYVEWFKTKWKVTNVEVQYPRLILTLGGVYNENED